MTERRPRSPYDLTTAAHDYPDRQRPPLRSLVVVTHPRSGSTLLGEALHAAGGLGCPLEYFHIGFRPAFADRWRTAALDDYAAALHRRRTDPAGTFSVKLFWRDLVETAVEAGLRPASDQPVPPGREDYAALMGLLRGLCPNPTFIYLRRQDRVREAISAYVAEQTGIFRALAPDDLQDTRRVVPYDYLAILKHLAGTDYAHAHWRAFFEASGIEPRPVAYETLIGDYQQTLQELLRELGHEGPVPEPRLARQSGDTSESLLLQFLRDDATGRRPPPEPWFNQA